jgi:hypothetical protein
MVLVVNAVRRVAFKSVRVQDDFEPKRTDETQKSGVRSPDSESISPASG